MILRIVLRKMSHVAAAAAVAPILCRGRMCASRDAMAAGVSPNFGPTEPHRFARRIFFSNFAPEYRP